MRRLIAVALLGAASLFAQIDGPVAGAVPWPDGRVDLVQGLPGSWTALTLRDGVAGTLTTSRTLILKAPDSVQIYDRQGVLLRSIPAPEGEALFAAGGEGLLRYAYFRSEERLVRYEDDGTPSFLGGPVSNGRVVALGLARGGDALLAIDDGEGIRVEQVDATTGNSREVALRPGLRAPVLFRQDGRLQAPPPGLPAEGMVALAGGWTGFIVPGGALAWDGANAFQLLPRAADDALAVFWRKNLDEEILLADTFTMPAAAIGSPGEARFRVKNTGNTPIRIFRLVVDGAGFTLFNDFIVPTDLAAGASAEFWVRFAPTSDTGYSGRIRLNDKVIALSGRAMPVTVPEVEVDGQWKELSTQTSNRIGDADRGQRFARRVRMRASSGAPEVPRIVAGEFVLSPLSADLYSAEFDAADNGMAESILEVSGRRYRLQVFVYEPAPPRPILKLSSATLGYAKQETIRVEFAEPSRTSTQGQLTLTFKPRNPAWKDDTSVGFLPNISRNVGFFVENGATAAKFELEDKIVLQTGTTAGTLTVTATLVGRKEELTIELEPQPVTLQTASISASDQQITMRVEGFDPVRETTRAAFTFYHRDGQVVAPGRIEADVTLAFQDYFALGSTTSGAFGMSAVFPVTGALAEIAGVEIEMTNARGSTKSQRLNVQ